MTLSPSIWSSSGRFNLCRTFAKTFSMLDYRKLEVCGGPTSSLLVDSEFRCAPVSQCLNADLSPALVSQCMKTDFSLCATLESLLLCFSTLHPSFSACEIRNPTQSGILWAVRRTRFQRGGLFRAQISWYEAYWPLILTTTGSSPVLLSWALFDMVFGFTTERKWLQENIVKFMTLNKRRRWFHSSRVKLTSVNMSTNRFLVSTYLTWMVGSKLTLSNNQSNATLWVLDTRLIARLLPFMIILNTASLSAKMYNWDSPWEELPFVTTWSTFDNSSTFRLPLLFNLFLGFALRTSLRMILRSPHLIDQEQECHPFANQHPKK